MRGRAKGAVLGLERCEAAASAAAVGALGGARLRQGRLPARPESKRVGRREGRFSAIKLPVLRNKIELIDFKVVYDSGQPDEMQVRKKIRDGGRPLRWICGASVVPSIASS